VLTKQHPLIFWLVGWHIIIWYPWRLQIKMVMKKDGKVW